MVKLFMKAGYEVVKKQGKGSHCKLEKGNKTSIVPMHKELKKGTEQKLLKELKS